MRPGVIRKDVAALRLRAERSARLGRARRRSAGRAARRRPQHRLGGGGAPRARAAGRSRRRSAGTRPPATCARSPTASCREASSRFANVLRSLGRRARATRSSSSAGGSRSSTSRCWAGCKLGAAVSPLFSAFGPEPIATRVNLGRGKVLVTTEALYQKKVAKIAVPMPTLEHVLRVDSARVPRGLRGGLAAVRGGGHRGRRHLVPALHQRHDRHAQGRGARARRGGDALRHRARWRSTCIPTTSSGAPPTRAGSPAPPTASSTPLVHGVTSIVDEADFDAERWYRILEEERVSVWYTAPTAIRMLMKAGAELREAARLPAPALHRERGRAAQPRGRLVGHGGVRHADPRQLVADGDRRDHDRQHGRDGREARLDGQAPARRRGGDRAPHGRRASSSRRGRTSEGELALRAGWPSMFRGYLGQEERYRKCFADGWYLTGDLAQARRRRLLLVRGPRRRRDQVRRPPDRPLRGRERPHGAPGRGRGGRDRQARPGGGRDREGLRLAQGRLRARRGAAHGDPRPRAEAPGCRGRAEGDRVLAPRFRARGAARSCAGCSRRASWGLPEGDLSTLEEGS